MTIFMQLVFQLYNHFLKICYSELFLCDFLSRFLFTIIEGKRRHYTVIRIKYQFYSIFVITFLLKKTKYIKKFKWNIHYMYQAVNNKKKRLSSIKKIIFL